MEKKKEERRKKHHPIPFFSSPFFSLFIRISQNHHHLEVGRSVGWLVGQFVPPPPKQQQQNKYY